MLYSREDRAISSTLLLCFVFSNGKTVLLPFKIKCFNEVGFLGEWILHALSRKLLEAALIGLDYVETTVIKCFPEPARQCLGRRKLKRERHQWAALWRSRPKCTTASRSRSIPLRSRDESQQLHCSDPACLVPTDCSRRRCRQTQATSLLSHTAWWRKCLTETLSLSRGNTFHRKTCRNPSQ